MKRLIPVALSAMVALLAATAPAAAADETTAKKLAEARKRAEAARKEAMTAAKAAAEANKKAAAARAKAAQEYRKLQAAGGKAPAKPRAMRAQTTRRHQPKPDMMSDPVRTGYMAITKIQALAKKTGSSTIALPALKKIAHEAGEPAVRRAALFAISDVYIQFGQPEKAAMALAEVTTVPRHLPPAGHTRCSAHPVLSAVARRLHDAHAAAKRRRDASGPHAARPSARPDSDRPSPEQVREMWKKRAEEFRRKMAERVREYHQRRREQQRDRDGDGRHDRSRSGIRSRRWDRSPTDKEDHGDRRMSDRDRRIHDLEQQLQRHRREVHELERQIDRARDRDAGHRDDRPQDDMRRRMQQRRQGEHRVMSDDDDDDDDDEDEDDDDDDDDDDDEDDEDDEDDDD